MITLLILSYKYNTHILYNLYDIGIQKNGMISLKKVKFVYHTKCWENRVEHVWKITLYNMNNIKPRTARTFVRFKSIIKIITMRRFASAAVGSSSSSPRTCEKEHSIV